MRTYNVNPIALLAGTAAIPLAANALGRAFITPKEGITNQNEANAELRRMFRNFAVFNALAAAGLGYAASRVKNDAPGWQTGALLGGAVGTGLVAAILGGALLIGPASEDPRQPQQLPTGATPVQGPVIFGVPNLIGVPR